ncbi:MAG: hypothetical protein WB791_08215 [Waddliaceae bacterium]
MLRYESDFGPLEKKFLPLKINKQRAAIDKLEKDRARVFELFKSIYYSEKKSLLQAIIINPVSAKKYLSTLDEKAFDRFSEERTIITAALKNNEEFIKKLGMSRLSILMSYIKEVNPELYTELIPLKHLQPISK